MKMHTYTPTERLKPFVKGYTVIESRSELSNTVLPGTSFALAFRIRGQISYLTETGKIALPPAAFSGLKRSVRRIHYAPDSAAIIVLFRETGVSAFFKQAPHELFEQSVSLDHFFPASEVSLVEERLAESEGMASKIAVIEEFLLSKMMAFHPDALVTEALAEIHALKGNIRINELARHLNISQDAFEKRFRKQTGASPKQFSHIVKMNALIRQNNPSPSFLDMAFEHGYFDQAHFNKYFRIFTGQSPSEFFKSASYW